MFRSGGGGSGINQSGGGGEGVIVLVDERVHKIQGVSMAVLCHRGTAVVFSWHRHGVTHGTAIAPYLRPCLFCLEDMQKKHWGGGCTR